jgi:hypothetical protein
MTVPTTDDDDRGSGGLERTTPRIDAISRCGCTARITWDEVYGWMHSDGARDGCRRPYPMGYSVVR